MPTFPPVFAKKTQHLPDNNTLPMSRKVINLFVLTIFGAAFCKNQPKDAGKVTLNAEGRQEFSAIYGSPILDGSGADDVWAASDWLPIDQVWFGAKPSAEDFEGRYKLAWDENNLYILAEIADDSLQEIHPEGTERYRDDDCLEIFIDEDASGGEHQYNYNAFAYHIALDGTVMDMTPDSTYRFFNDHCLIRMINRGHETTWEIAVRIYDEAAAEDQEEGVPQLLKSGKKMGFALAYNDNDGSPERENCIGNVIIPDGNKNRAWSDAGVFGLLYLR